MILPVNWFHISPLITKAWDFEMIPDKTTYKIVADYDGKKYDFSFSNIISSGYVMRVTDLDAETYQVHLQNLRTCRLIL